jgi:hypothetical protein
MPTKSIRQNSPGRPARPRPPAGRAGAALLAAAALWLLAAGASRADGPDAPAAPPFAPIEFLVGGVWQGDLPPSPDGQAVRLESRYSWAENHQAIRFDSTWIVAGKRHPYASGLYAWDPAKKQLAVWYTDAAGSLGAGAVFPAGQSVQEDLTVTDGSGLAEAVRARFTPAGADRCQEDLFTLKAGQWERLVTVLYHRAAVPKAAPP